MRLLVIVFLFLSFAFSQKGAINYQLIIANPKKHEVRVKIEAEAMKVDTLTFAMPAWSPGRYVIYNFSKNVFDVRAFDNEGNKLQAKLADKQTWKVPCKGKTKVRFEYSVFANTLDGTFSKVDSSGASVNGAGIFMYVAGRKHLPVTLKIKAPEQWKIVTSLKRNENGYYQAADYDRLIDSPIEMGGLYVYRFEELNKPHLLVFHRPVRQEILRRFEDDLKKVIRFQAGLFDGELPYSRYVFFFSLSPDLKHTDGMEHLNSCRVLLRMDIDSIDCDANTDPDYDNLIWLSAHEFFHTWNVKRLRPAGLGPFDYSREVYTPSLWIAEGWTSYYAYLSLVRTGIYTGDKFLYELASRITRYERDPGKKYRNLTEVSILTWLFKGNVPVYEETNIDETTYSYYYKGLIAGWLLDILLRSQTGGAYSLDALLNSMWNTFYKQGGSDYYLPGRGYSEQEVESMVVEQIGEAGGAFLKKVVHSTDPLPYEIINKGGLRLKYDHSLKRYFIEKIPDMNESQKRIWRELTGAEK